MDDYRYELKSGEYLAGEDARIFEKIMSLNPLYAFKYDTTDIGLGNLFAECFNDKIRYCLDDKKWYFYTGAVWEKDIGEIETQCYMQRLLQLLPLYCREVKNDDNKDTVTRYLAYVKKSSSDLVIKRGINTSKNMMKIRITDFDKDPYLLNCSNGIYDLRTGKQIPHSPEYFMTKITNTHPTIIQSSFIKTTIKPCKRWYQFIDEIMSHDKEKISFLQRALGYSLLGVNKEECMFLAYGAKSRNGKGTLFHSLSKALGSGYMGSVDTGLICEDKRGKIKDFNAPQPALRKIVGTRIVTMSETDRDVKLASASMKSITGRDELTTRGLNENPITFIPQFKMWLSTNHLPMVTDDTVFKSDRIWVIPFDAHFDTDNRDNALKDYLSQPDNLPTVLNWLIEGCKDYLANGLNPPKCVIEATQNYREMYDKTGMFLKECCEIGEDKKVLRSNLNMAYRNWCNKPDNRFTPLGSQKFYNEIALRGYRIGKYAGEFYVYGLSVKDQTTPGMIVL